DAIIGMEGNGPTMGKPRAIGAILASESPYALDLVGADMIGLTAKDVPTLAAATARGLCTDQVSEIEIVGDEMIHISDFDLILSHHSVQFEGSGGSKKLYGKTLGALLTSKPTPKKDMCVGCGLCNNICPAKAITMVNKIPVIDRKKCIRCFCCQEFCPKGAMVVKRPFIASLLSGKTNKKK
ncbi:MAG: 4Fe-4S binding protein, partial [Clostridia bacterium]|nr:4Fe-4S binding protein [Clostridia bacterium]